MGRQIREHTYSLINYLEMVKRGEIREDRDVQRLAGQWDAGMRNELIYTALTGDYMQPVILGEEERKGEPARLWLADGVQRTSCLMLFRYGNYKVTSALENSIIECKPGETDGVFDLRGAVFESLPGELKQAFDSFPVRTVIHPRCSTEQISGLIRRYNNQIPMSSSQTALTHVYRYAGRIRELAGHGFFKNCASFTEREKIHGVYERVICETVTAAFHSGHWQKQAGRMGKYLNTHGTAKEFEILRNVLDRMENLLKERFRGMFNSKDAFIWLALACRFAKRNENLQAFGGFLEAFQDELHCRPVEKYGFKTFDMACDSRTSREKETVIKKLGMLECLLEEWLSGHSAEDHAGAETRKRVS